MDLKPRTIVEGMTYTESPRWHGDRIWFSDFFTNRVHSATADGDDLRVEAEVPHQPSGLGWLPDGRLLIVSMRDQTILRAEPDGTLAVHADLSSFTDTYLNDMAVDAAGRAYVGDFGFDLFAGAPFEVADLFRVDPDGSVTVVANDMRFANGTVITDDGTLLVNETLGNRITAFDIEGDGSLTNRRSWVEFGPEPTARDLMELFGQVRIAADGGCRDAEGAMWVADALGSRAVRVLPDGTIDQEISPGIGIYACMLGGADGRTLFLCACSVPDFDESARAEARDGRILAVDVAVPRSGRP